VPYNVELWVGDGEPTWSCTCPAAEDGSFCKHCVAVALLFDRDARDVGDGVESPHLRPVPSPTESDLAGYVAGLPYQRLVELVLTQVESDWRLRERLAADARAARGEGPELGPWRRRIDVAFAPYDDFVDYREAAGWASDVDGVIDALEDLCDAGHPDAVTVLTEHAHRRADEAIQYVDDSDGWLTGISERLSDLHLRACAEGSPDPVALARRLVDLELTAELDGFHRAAATYAEVLDDAGLDEYRRIVEPRWEKVAPAQHAGDWSAERFRLREAMIGLALASGDPDEMIAVRSRDLRTPDDYLEIAHALEAGGRPDEALDWARRGLDAYADRTWQTSPLRELTAELLRQRGDRAGAVELFWEAFERSPSVGTYRRLLDEAGDDAPAWRRRSIDTLRTLVAETTRHDRTATSWRAPTPTAALVEILAHEGDIDAAWEAATDHGCDDRLWLTLARARESTHPIDAIDVYEREVFAQIDRKRNDAYRSAVELVARIRRLADTAGEPERFQTLLTRVRTEHKAKRNLKALLDQKPW
jgi:tetratricopeptide (TPR) repeat protein